MFKTNTIIKASPNIDFFKIRFLVEDEIAE